MCDALAAADASIYIEHLSAHGWIKAVQSSPQITCSESACTHSFYCYSVEYCLEVVRFTLLSCAVLNAHGCMKALQSSPQFTCSE